MTVQRLVVLLVLVIVFVGCSKDESSKPKGVSSVEQAEKIESLIIQLGDSDSYVAQKASERLIMHGLTALVQQNSIALS